MLKEVKDAGEFESILASSDTPVALLFYGSFSDVSKKVHTTCGALSDQDGISGDIKCYSVDVGSVKGLHKRYNVSSVPTLVVFRDGEPKEWIMGEQSEGYFKDVLLDRKRLFTSQDGEEGKKFPPITVYSTPTCGYCTKLKNHLDSHGVPYRDIDVSRDQKAAEDLVNRTGQQGVPQSFIGGTHIMGFDQAKIDRLLGLSS